jgi:hypothetical protein
LKGIFVLIGALIIGMVLCTFPRSAAAADTANDLPARVETNQYLPPVPGAVPSATLAAPARMEVATALPGQPFKRAANSLRAIRARPRLFLFRGPARGRGGCG